MTWPSITSTLEVVTTMNEYGARAQKIWQAEQPARYAQIEDPQAFFTQKGLEIAAEIDRRRNELEQQTGAGQSESFLANLGSLNTQQIDVTAAVMQEMVYAELSETTS